MVEEKSLETNQLAAAFIIGENFIENDNVALIFGDNIFHRYDFTERLMRASKEMLPLFWGTMLIIQMKVNPFLF